jgi:hypothetical protein
VTFEPRTNPVTGETFLQYVDWKPTGVPPHEMHGRMGDPLREFLVFNDRVEIQESWSITSGHAELYEDGPRIAIARAEAEAEITRRFGAELAATIARAFVDLGNR